MSKTTVSNNNMEKTNKRQTWKQDPKMVKDNILKVATKEMSTHGLSGSRINVIAEQCDTSKRMIYYYFKDKEGLYKAVLEATYRSIRNAENSLNIENLHPKEALEELIDFTIIHHSNNPDFIRLIMIENIHNSKYLKLSSIIQELNSPAIKRIEDIYKKGVKENVFKNGLDPLEIHWYISALSFFNVSNKSSFNTAFGTKLSSIEKQKELALHIKQMIINFVIKD